MVIDPILWAIHISKTFRAECIKYNAACFRMTEAFFWAVVDNTNFYATIGLSQLWKYGCSVQLRSQRTKYWSFTNLANTRALEERSLRHCVLAMKAKE